MEGWGDHLPYFPPLASASNTTLGVGCMSQHGVGTGLG